MYEALANADADAAVVVSHAGEGRYFRPFAGLTCIVRVPSAAVGSRFTIIDVIAEPSVSPPMHFHKEDEVFEVLEGRVTFCCDRDLIPAEPGSIVVVPSGTYHSWINRSDAPVRMRVTMTPGGAEAAILPFVSGLSHAELCDLAARHGTYIVGPSLGG